MTSTGCDQCVRLGYDLCIVRTQLQQQHEELCILRKAQRDCADMAAEIQELHMCVEEQRRHLQAQSSKPKDPGVGIFSWMDMVSKQHLQREAVLRETHQQELLAVQQQLAYVTAQMSSMTLMLQQAQQTVMQKNEEVEVAYRCINEQRRHIHSVVNDGATGDVDVGLLPLVRAGHVQVGEADKPVPEEVPAQVPPDVLTRAHMCFVLATEAAELGDARVKDELASCRATIDTLNRDKAALGAKLVSVETSMHGLACENVSLTAQVAMLNEAVTSLQEASSNIDEVTRIQTEFESLATTNEKLQVDVARLTKERDATVKGIRHWQAEAQKITADLVAALESRDRFQAEQFTALKQCRQLTTRCTELEREVAGMFKFHQLGQQVFGLVQVVGQAYVNESEKGQVSPGGDTPVAEGETGSKKKNKKKKKNC